MPRFVIISDTHNQLSQVSLPDGDTLLHCGDATMEGTAREIERLAFDFENLKDKFKRIIYVPGNHDFEMQDSPFVSGLKLRDHCTILVDDSVEVDGYNIYGSPWQPWFHDWAFNFPERDLESGKMARAKWAEIPIDTDILITHGPPFMILDKVARNPQPHVGCPFLAERINELVRDRPVADRKHKLVHAFGHIHERYGQIETNDVHYINAATCNLFYKPYNAPVVLDLP